ncbi:MAG: hypothetical protein HYW27_03215 [Candidatus Aenigmarchaeota archaeon]|nr:hypothetical protein [Candidatus Aenigmarchaeota archaeon]
MLSAYMEFMSAVRKLRVGEKRVVPIGVYPGRTEIRMTARGPVAVYSNGSDSGLERVFLTGALPEPWAAARCISEYDLRRATERLSSNT